MKYNKETISQQSLLLQGNVLHANDRFLGQLAVNGIRQLLIERLVQVGKEGGGKRAR